MYACPLALTVPFLLLTAMAHAAPPATQPTTLPAREHVKVFLLIGQSNMAGRGKVEAQDQLAPPRVVTLNKADRWVPAIDPIHHDKPIAGVGLGRSFGIFLAEKFPNDTIALVPSAMGGAAIAQWARGTPLYDNALRRARIALKDGQLAGILWHQGEADRNLAHAYTAKAEKLFADLRADLDAPNVPVIVGTLGDFVPGCEKLNPTLKELPKTISHSACADAAGLKDRGDNLHFNSEACRELGKRYAEQFLKIAPKPK